ncbi:unnamed protein product [Cylicocyclus nassatus]|uniref:Uncharacterized protein n=1 Tax=Cylicocyclus nassatus TaxID=53992 RepID=A0AA36GHY7_CYLNA|nr:unnamed protein product [Cylicocyclus nassatus]
MGGIGKALLPNFKLSVKWNIGISALDNPRQPTALRDNACLEIPCCGCINCRKQCYPVSIPTTLSSTSKNSAKLPHPLVTIPLPVKRFNELDH